MKPDWKDAPDWANWLAVDGWGQWFWFSDEPTTGHSRYWRLNKIGKSKQAYPDVEPQKFSRGEDHGP